MTTSEPSATRTAEEATVRMRLLSDSEDTWTLRRPSVGAFETVRRLALRSSKVPLARKFDICKELALDWRIELSIENRKSLDKLLDNIQTDDPAQLGEKVLDARGIKERFGDHNIDPFELCRQVLPVLFADDGGNAPSVGPESADNLLIGNVQKALGLFFQRINIDDDEDLTGRVSFRAFINSDKQYPITDVTVRTMRQLNELQVLSSAIPEKDRRQICEEMRWSFRKVTPENITDMHSKPEYWRQAAGIVLKGVDSAVTDANKDLIDAGEVNRALAVFFAKSDGLL